MKGKLLIVLVQLIMKMLTPDLLKVFADRVLDFAEDYVLGSKSKIDDALVLPVCGMIRTTFDIPDNDEVPEPGEDNIHEPPIYVDEEQPERMKDE